jgi:hypothetical protein
LEAEVARLRFRPEVADFVYQVLCARARQGGAPLEAAMLRGLMLRCGVRPVELAPMAARPAELLNMNKGSLEELSLVAELFGEALGRALESVPPGAQGSFRQKINGTVAMLRATTPYPLGGLSLAPVAPPEAFLPEDPPPPPPPPPPSRAEALAALASSLPALRAVRPPRPAPQVALRRPSGRRLDPSTARLEGLAPWLGPWRVGAARALLAEALPALEVAAPGERARASAPPRPASARAELRGPLPLPARIPGEFIQRAGLVPGGELRGWRRAAAWGSSVLGFVLGAAILGKGVLMGLNLWVIGLGVLVIGLGLGIDIALSWRGGVRRAGPENRRGA